MFARIKKSGKYQYLQIVENKKVKGKVRQRVIATVGRMDKLQAKGEVETLVRSLSRFSDKVLLVLSGKSEAKANSKKIGPALIFERLWEELGIKAAIRRALSGRKFKLDSSLTVAICRKVKKGILFQKKRSCWGYFGRFFDFFKCGFRKGSANDSEKLLVFID